MKYHKSIAYIAATLLLILLLPLMAGCAQQPQYATSTPEIPEGWEIVSTDENVTYLQMKEGADAYYWKEETYYDHHEVNLTVLDLNLSFDVQIAGNPDRAPLMPDQDGNIYFIVYFGSYYCEETDGQYHLLDAPADAPTFSYNLHIESGSEGWMGGVSGSPIFPEKTWTIPTFSSDNNVVLKTTTDPESREAQLTVGLTRAAIVAIPYDKLEDDWRLLILRVEQVNGYREKEFYQEYGKWNGAVYFNSEDLLTAVNPFFTDWRGVISWSLLACSLVVMIFTAIFKKNCFLHLIPIVLGIIYNVHVMYYLIDLPNPPELDGLILQTLALILCFIAAGLALLIIRLLIGLSRRLVNKMNAKT